jgi:uncharacterized protein (TIGR03437 family)
VSIAIDAAGNAFIAGNTNGTGLPATTGAIQTTGLGAFVFKVNAGGAGIRYLTMLGSANYFPPPVATNSAPGNFVTAIAADAAGNAYITGCTSDPNFPGTPGSYHSQPSFTVPPNDPFFAPPSDAFVAKINPTGTSMVWSTFLGGSAPDAGARIALDASGGVWIAGSTSSVDFPANSGFPGGGEFLVEITSAGTALAYASRFPSSTAQAGVAIDSIGVVHTAGSNGLVCALTPSGAAPRLFGIANAAVGSLGGRIAPAEAISIYGLHFGVATPVSGVFNSAGLLPTMLAGVPVTIGGMPAPLLYVSDTQINAVVPKGVALNSASTLQVSNGATILPAFRTMIDQVTPGVFLQPNSSVAAAIHQDGTVNSAANPAHSGSIVSIWATGVNYASGSDGQMATAAQQGCSCLIFGGQGNGAVIVPAYAGAAPGMPSGIVQINFRVMTTATAPPTSAYYVSIDNKFSNVFTIYVSQ